MSITKKGSKKSKSHSLKGKTSRRYLVPETAIRNFVGSLTIRSIDAAAARFQTVADVTQLELDNQLEQLAQSSVQLIKDLAGESTNKQYLRIMKAILASVKKGPRGIDVAHRTAGHVVELAFGWTLTYFAALDSYRAQLRERGRRRKLPDPYREEAVSKSD